MKLFAIWLPVLLVGCSSGSGGDVVVDIAGTVVDVSNGLPIEHAGVTLTMPSGARGPHAVTIFTSADGHFQFSEAGAMGAKIEVNALGYSVASPERNDGIVELASDSTKRPDLHFILQPTGNIGKDAPASAWLDQQGENPDRNIVNLECSGCHQFPSPKVRAFAEQVEAIRGTVDGERKALEAWRRQIRVDSWRMATKYMRAKIYSIFPEQSDLQLVKTPWSIVQDERYALTKDSLNERIAQYLADNMPHQFNSLNTDAYIRGAPIGVTDKTTITEYQLPSDTFVREAVMVSGSPYIWGADLRNNRLLRLDPDTGEQKWFPVPFKKATGPHTLVPGKNGMLWVSMIENDKFGRFDTKTGEWKLWTLTPQNMKTQNFVGGQASVHDIAFDDHGDLARDPKGRIWLTLIGLNMMAAINPDTDEVTFHSAAPAVGFSPAGASLYGTLLSSDGKCAWYSQLHGVVGCMNTLTYQNERLFSFPAGYGPRRLARGADDTLWVPMFGAGKLVKLDTRKHKVLAEYDLPDRNAAPYALTWDERRNLVWVTTSNADVIYSFDPEKEAFKVYPLPRKQAYFRQLYLDQKSGKLVGTYGNIPSGSGPTMIVVIEPGDEPKDAPKSRQTNAHM